MNTQVAKKKKENYSYRAALLYNIGRRSNWFYPGFDPGIAATMVDSGGALVC
jgi:hypothetical protein